MISSLSVQNRRDQLQSLITKNGSVDLVFAAEQLGVSEMTIRRDLQELEKDGLVKRVRGGAILVEAEQFDRRQARNHSAKVKIATKLTELLPSYGLVAFDSSTTIYQFATQMPPQKDLHVFTTGTQTFQLLQGKAGRVMLSGGELDEPTGALVGLMAEQTLEDFHFTRTFVSIAGVDAEFGTTDSTFETASYKRAIRKRSGTMVVAADSSKLGQTASAIALPLSEIDILVTELDPRNPKLDPIRDQVQLL